MNPGYIQIQTQVPAIVNVCDQEREFTIRLSNVSVNVANSNATNIVTEVLMPAGMAVVEVSPAYTPDVSLDNSILNNPKFTISPSIAPGAFFEFKFTARATPEIINSIQLSNPGGSSAVFANITKVLYNFGITRYKDEEQFAAPSFNVTFPVLNVILDQNTNDQVGTKHDILSRRFSVKNGGDGRTNKFTVALVYGNSNLQFVRLKNVSTNTILIPLTISGNTVTFLIDMGSSYLSFLDEIVFEETCRINSCGGLQETIQTNFKAIQSCDNKSVSRDSTFANLISYTGNPWVVNAVNLVAQQTPAICSTSSMATVEFTSTNVGSTATPGIVNDALNFSCELQYSRYGATTTPVIRMFNYSTQTYVSLSSLNIVHTVTENTLSNNCHRGTTIKINFDNQSVLLNDIDGPGGLSDLDNDSYFDDLAQDKSIKFNGDFDFGLGIQACLECPGKLEQSFDYYSDAYNSCNPLSKINYFPFDNHAKKRLLVEPAGSDLVGPTDLIGGQTASFELKLSGVFENTLGVSCGTDFLNFQTILRVPVGFTIPDGTLQWQGPNGTFPIVVPPLNNNNEYVINGGGLNGKYVFDILATCGSNSSTSPTLLFNWETSFTCSGCATIKKLVCNSFELYNHCPNCPGVHTTFVTAERTSLGWALPGAQYSLASLQATPRLKYSSLTQAQKSQLRLDRVLAYDTVPLEAIGKIIFDESDPLYTGTTYSNPFIVLSFEFTPSSGFNPLNIFELINPRIASKIGSSTCTTSVTPSASLTTLANGNSLVKYTFTLSSDCSGNSSFTLTNGDRFDLLVTLVAQEAINQNISLTLQEHVLKNFRVQHFATKSGDSGPSSCESFGARMSFVSNTTGSFSGIGDNPSCVEGTFWIVLYNKLVVGNPAQWAQDYFTNEFRPYGTILSVKHTASPSNPIWYDPLPKVEDFQWWFNTLDVITTVVTPPMALPPGPSYTWNSSMWPVRETFTQGAERIFFIPRCTTASNVSFNTLYQPYLYVNNPSFIQSKQVTFNQSTPMSSRRMSANLQVSGALFQEGISRDVVWPVSVCNSPLVGSVEGPAPKVWAAFEPQVPNIFITSVVFKKPGFGPVSISPSTYTTAAGGIGYMFQLDQFLDAGQCFEMDVIGQYNNCEIGREDQVKMMVSYGCDVYPSSPMTVGCSRPTIVKNLSLVYRQAGLEVTLLKTGPGTTANICDEVEYQATFTSTNIADMNNLFLTLELFEDPELAPDNGVSIVPESGTYEYNGSAGTFPIPARQGHNYIFDLSNTIPLLDNTPSGSLPGSTQPGKSQLKVNFKIKTSCSFEPQAPVFQWSSSGKTNCQESIETALLQTKLGINGLDPLDNIGLDLNAAPFSAGLSHVTITANNLDPHILYSSLPLVNRYIVFRAHQSLTLIDLIPAYDFYLTNPASAGYKYYYFKIPAIAAAGNAGSTYSVSFNLRDNGFEAATGTCIVPVWAAVRMVLPNAGCNGSSASCEAGANLVIKSATLTLPGCVPCENCIDAFNPQYDSTYILSVWVREANSGSSTSYLNSYATVVCEGVQQTFGPFRPAGNIIDGWQRIEGEFKVPAGTSAVEVRFHNSSSGDAFFDDLRIHPFNSSFKAFVYDPKSLRLWSELDERNYATFYEYDQEGGLIRVKKETERGIMTITESRSNTVKK